jgi:mannose-6-phosphate isomerase-like protein (cupin superfamily)
VPGFETRSLPEAYDVLAPDGSEIRLLQRLSGGSVAHGRLPVGQVSLAVQHRTVEEIWYVLSGSAEIWRRLRDQESVETIAAGNSLTIPVGTEFQFRTTGDDPFEFIMCTMPPWQGADEAVLVEGRWSPADVT